MSDLIAMVALAAVLAISYFLDLGVVSTWGPFRGAFQIGSQVWGAIVIDLVLVTVLLIMFWLVAVRLKPSAWTTILFLAVGLFFTLFLPVSYTGHNLFSDFVASSVFNPIRSMLISRGAGSQFLLASEAILVTGLATLFNRGPAEEDD